MNKLLTSLFIFLCGNAITAQNNTAILRSNFPEVVTKNDYVIENRYNQAIDIARVKHTLAFVADSQLTAASKQAIKDYIDVLKQHSGLPYYEQYDFIKGHNVIYIEILSKIEQWDVGAKIKVTELPNTANPSILIRNFLHSFTTNDKWRGNIFEVYEHAIEIARLKNEIQLNDTGGLSPQLIAKVKNYAAVIQKKSPDFIYNNGNYYYVRQNGKIEKWLISYYYEITYPEPTTTELVLANNFPDIAAEDEDTKKPHKGDYETAIEVMKAKHSMPGTGILSVQQKATIREYDSILNGLSPRYFETVVDHGEVWRTYVKTGTGNKLEVWAFGDSITVYTPNHTDDMCVFYQSMPELYVPGTNVGVTSYFFFKAIKEAAEKKPLEYKDDCMLTPESRKRVKDIYDRIYNPEQMVADIFNILAKPGSKKKK